MYNPCLECYNRYGRTYSVACDKICDYAQCMQMCHQLQLACREWRTVAGYGYKATKDTTKRLEWLLGKEVTADGK